MTDKPIPRRLRFEILRRDGHTCRYCGASAPDVPLTVDHVVPRALGGDDEPSNLVAACKDCNSGKSSTSPDEHVVADVDQRALRWAAAMQQVAETRRAQWAQLDQDVARFDHAWAQWWYGEDKRPIPRDDDWRRSITRFLEAGLDIADLEHFVHVAGNSKASAGATWKYFCGCCWTELNERQEAALNAVSPPASANAEDYTESPDYDRGYDDGFHDGRQFERPQST